MPRRAKSQAYLPVQVQLDRIFTELKGLKTAVAAGFAALRKGIMAKLDDLANDITDLNTVEDGLVKLLEDYKAKIDAAAGDQTKIDAIHDQFVAQKKKLADALTANTPAAPAAGVKKPGKARAKK